MKRILRHVLSTRLDSRKYAELAILFFVAIQVLFMFSSRAWAETDMARSQSLTDKPKGDNQVVAFDINHDFHASGKLSSLRVFLGIPKTIEGSQNVINVIFSPSPMAVYDDNDTRYAVFNFHNPPENLTLSVKGEIELHRRDLVTALSSKSASGQSSPTDLSYAERTEHLKAEKFIEVNDPVIRKIADGIDGPTQRLARMTQPQGVAASQSADIETVQEVLQWLRRNVKYDPENRPSGAASTAKLGKGMCQEFSELFVALCRAKGLPAKYVGGLNTSFDKRNPNSNPSHAWAEVFLTGLGWVPFDPTWMESTSDVVPPTYLCLTKIRNNIALGIANDTAWFYTYRTPVTVKTSDTYKFKALSP